ncbi:hypothetical protein D3C79_844480 [compost metagenome]
MVPYGAVWLQNDRHVPQFVLSRIALERSDNVFTLDDSRRFRHFIVGSFLNTEMRGSTTNRYFLYGVWRGFRLTAAGMLRREEWLRVGDLKF